MSKKTYTPIYGGQAWTPAQPSMSGVSVQQFPSHPGGPSMRSQRPRYPHPSFAPRISTASGGSLFENIGNTIRLGVDVINASLLGSLRLIEGLLGEGAGYGGNPYDWGYGHHPHHFDPCCETSFYDNPYECTPSVHGW